MAQDYAKRRTADRNGNAPPRKKPLQRRSADVTPQSTLGKSLRVYAAGLLSGVFLSFVVYLGTLSPDTDPAGVAGKPAQPEEQPPKPRFDFYNMLPEQTIEMEVEPSMVEPAADISKPHSGATGADVYLLQAGSFRQEEDAQRRRAELLLLGLEPNVEASESDNGRWFRVYLGPFETHAAMSRARGLAANQNIDTLLLKSGPR